VARGAAHIFRAGQARVEKKRLPQGRFFGRVEVLGGEWDFVGTVDFREELTRDFR
jgi:hypothetical protein